MSSTTYVPFDVFALVKSNLRVLNPVVPITFLLACWKAPVAFAVAEKTLTPFQLVEMPIAVPPEETALYQNESEYVPLCKATLCAMLCGEATPPVIPNSLKPL